MRLRPFAMQPDSSYDKMEFQFLQHLIGNSGLPTVEGWVAYWGGPFGRRGCRAYESCPLDRHRLAMGELVTNGAWWQGGGRVVASYRPPAAGIK